MEIVSLLFRWVDPDRWGKFFLPWRSFDEALRMQVVCRHQAGVPGGKLETIKKQVIDLIDKAIPDEMNRLMKGGNGDGDQILPGGDDPGGVRPAGQGGAGSLHKGGEERPGISGEDQGSNISGQEEAPAGIAEAEEKAVEKPSQEGFDFSEAEEPPAEIAPAGEAEKAVEKAGAGMVEMHAGVPLG